MEGPRFSRLGRTGFAGMVEMEDRCLDEDWRSGDTGFSCQKSGQEFCSTSSPSQM